MGAHRCRQDGRMPTTSLPAYSRTFPNSPHAADARFNLAESANMAHHYAEVVRLLTPLTATTPAEASQRLLPAVLYRLGRTQVELKDWASAVATFDRLLAGFPNNPYRRESQYLRAKRPSVMVMAPGPKKGSPRFWPNRRWTPIPRGWSRPSG